ncbi:hypothetical protein I302_101903 [Kwoniella bestiolae CBS 10118]|uniref:Uncharacterized protein n=1 Tax=Kwoniella bestiolae CBS 10118 TaxID=1296100 RepID=A0A1B9GDJ3_9TREE|nr:hypothetical protein I302_00584 [Kwoniella bestiolae CBS 10118]OCF29092.1 hypothetical protein I302_00584 [Kwoniella bestiolae CBS 10118]
MPPLFTSTSWTTLVRKVASAMVYAPKPAVAIKVTPKRTTINHIQKVRQVIQQSFPSLAIPSHQLNHSYATIPLKSSSRQFSSSTKAAKRLGPVRQGLNQVGARPRWVNGPSIQANVGLGNARTFVSSTYPTAQNVVNGKVPMVFRAFVSLMEDEENKLSGNKGLPRASRYTPYIKSKSARRIRRSSTRSIDSSFIEDLKHYFPLPTRSSAQEITVTLPLLPETLITEGKTTILALPLSPSLEALLLPTSQIRYNETEIGISILSRLTRGLLSIHNAFSLHSSTRIIPLLNKLDGLGVLDYHPHGLGRVEAEVVNDGDDQPDILRLIFHHRSISDVRMLLGESLRENEEGQWWALYDDSRLEMELNQNERKEIMENWTSPVVQPITPQAKNNEQLVFPTLDMSQGEVLFDISESILSSPSDSWPSTPSGFSTPLPTDSPISDIDLNDDDASMSMLSSTGSLTESLLSRFSSSSDEAQGVWSVHPSDSDSDVESSSVFSQEVEEWNAVDQILSASNGEEQEVEEVMVSWSGSGEGFGFLAQPW